MADRDVARLALKLCTLLGEARQRARLVQLLRLCSALFLSLPHAVTGAVAAAAAADEALKAQLQPELCAVEQVLSQPDRTLSLFCRGLGLETLLSTLLTGMPPPRRSSSDSCLPCSTLLVMGFVSLAVAACWPQ